MSSEFQATEVNRPKPQPAVGRGAEQKQRSEASSGDTGAESGRVAPAPEESEKSEDPGKVEQAVELLNKSMDVLNRDIKFNILEEEGVVQAEIHNDETGKIIRSIPSDEVLLVRKKIDAFMGLFVDTLK